jgi:hypothetical protein
VPHFSYEDRDIFEEWISLGCPSWFIPEGTQFPVSAVQLCDLLARCSDVLPAETYGEACRLHGIRPRKRTYAAMARELGRIARSPEGAVS